MSTRLDGRGRGQVLIVVALVVAAIFVGLALVLNSGIYAENLSSRETTDTEDALSFTLATDEAVAEAYERTNRNGSATADEARATFNATVDDWESAQQRRGAKQGVGVDVERSAHVGWRLNQSTDRNLTSDDDATGWRLADGATDVAEFELDVTRTSLHDASADWSNTAGEAFNVTVEDASGARWHLYVFEDAANGSVVVHAGDPGDYADLGALLADGSRTCSETASRAVVDFRNETLAGATCEPLNFSDDVGSSVDVSYTNGDSASGTYELVVNGSSAAETSNFYGPDSGADPTATAVVYSASFTSHYGRSDLVHERHGTYLIREETHAS